MMQQKMTRFYRVGDWLYEVKSVRAIRVQEYGEPYTGTVNFNFNGDESFIDSYLVRGDETTSRADWQSFYDFSRIMEAKSINYDRVHRGKIGRKTITITENLSSQPKPSIRLVE